MNNKAQLVIFSFFIFLIVFICAIFIGEYKNIEALKTQKHGIPISDKAIAYRKTNLKIWAINLIISFLIPSIFLLTGLSTKLMHLVEESFKSKFSSVAAFAFIYLIINFLIKLPLRYYSSFVVSHRFGLSNQTMERWLSNVLKSLAIDLVIWMVFLWFPYYIIYRHNSRWWLYLGLLSIPIYFFATYITPTFIDPLFNEYTPIQDETLELRIRQQLKKAGIEECNVYQVNKSIDTKNMNAYMTGTFKSKRIVLWDTTIDNLTQDETISILSHEIGHYIKGHIWKSIILGGISTIFVLFLTDKLCMYLLKNSNATFGFSNLHNIASLPLILLVLNGLLFFSSPVVNAYSRHLERQADAIEIELTDDPELFISGLTKLYEQNLSLPKPSKLYRFWYYSHPAYEERVNFAKNYASEHDVHSSSD